MTDMNEIVEVAEQAIKEAREGNYKASEAIAKLEGIRRRTRREGLARARGGG